MRRKVEPEILQAAIKLFGLHSYEGVTTRGLAKEAQVVEGAIYTWFGDKQNLYLRAINQVVTQMNHEFAQFVLKVFGSAEEPEPGRVAEEVRGWIEAIPRPSARLLLQVLLSDDKRDKLAREALNQITNALAKALDRHKKTNRALNAPAAAKTLVRTLFWGRVMEGKAGEQEMDAILEQWLLGLEVR